MIEVLLALGGCDRCPNRDDNDGLSMGDKSSVSIG
jgi:hypothetical protein